MQKIKQYIIVAKNIIVHWFLVSTVNKYLTIHHIYVKYTNVSYILYIFIDWYIFCNIDIY